MKKANLFSITALLLLAMTAPVRANTNFFPLLTVGDKTFTNATITRVTPAEATVFFDGGGAQVPLSNLPVELQKRYQYDPEKAARFLAEEQATKAAAKKRDAEAAARMAAMSEPVPIRILGYEGAEKYNTDVGTIWLKNVPAQTIQYVTNRLQTAEHIRTITAQIQANEAQARFASDVVATNLYYRYYNPFYAYGVDVMAQAGEARRLTQSVADQKLELEKWKEYYNQSSQEGEHLAKLMASRTMKQYQGFPIWVSLGIAPQNDQTLTTTGRTNEPGQ